MSEDENQPSPSTDADERDLLRHLMTHTIDNIYFKDTEGRFRFISNSMAGYFGLDDPEEAVGKSDYDFFSEEHARQAMEDEKEILETGKIIVNKVEKETWQDGRVTWVSTSKEPLFDSNGTLIGTFGISRDVTAQKEAEERAHRYAEKLKAANDLMQADLELAGEMQLALLPKGYPVIPAESDEQHGRLRFAHIYQPSELVGGDFFTVVPLSGQRVAVVVCDGMGHGVRAAMLAVILYSLFRAQEHCIDTPVTCMERVNRELRSILEPLSDFLFATGFCMVVNAGTGAVQYVTAGHQTPIVLRKESGKVEALMHEGMECDPALGLLPEPNYQVHEAQLHEGDRVVLYTDGLIEEVNSDEEEYGEERLMKVLQDSRELEPPAMLECALQAVKAFAEDRSFTDDVCALCLERT